LADAFHVPVELFLQTERIRAVETHRPLTARTSNGFFPVPESRFSWLARGLAVLLRGADRTSPIRAGVPLLPSAAIL